jgi:hypothetical protein
MRSQEHKPSHSSSVGFSVLWLLLVHSLQNPGVASQRRSRLCKDHRADRTWGPQPRTSGASPSNMRIPGSQPAATTEWGVPEAATTRKVSGARSKGTWFGARPNVSSFCCAASPLTSAQRFTYFFGVSSNGLLDGGRSWSPSWLR